jgi:hypothetical protein
MRKSGFISLIIALGNHHITVNQRHDYQNRINRRYASTRYEMQGFLQQDDLADVVMGHFRASEPMRKSLTKTRGF